MAWARAAHRGKEWGAVIHVPGVPKKFVVVHPAICVLSREVFTKDECLDVLLRNEADHNNSPESRYIYGVLHSALRTEVI